MSRGLARGAFLTILGLLATVLVLAVREIPQPWRGVIVGWLLLMGSLGLLVLRFVTHYLRYKSLQLTTRQPARPAPPVRRVPPAQSAPVGELKVISSNEGSQGRHTIR